MSASITEPTRKNVSTQFEAQASTEVSSTVGGQSVKFTINRPNKFKTPTVSDSQELDDILSTALIHFSAESSNVTLSAQPNIVGGWTNLGTGGSVYDAFAAANGAQASEGITIFSTRYSPTIESVGHPFDSALKFDTQTSTSKNRDSKNLLLGKRFSPTDSFVLFFVIHEPEQASLGSNIGMSGTPFGFSTDSVSPLASNYFSYPSLLIDTNTASGGFPRVKLNSIDQSTSPSSSANYAFSYGSLSDPRFTGEKTIPPITEAFVVRVDKDKVAHLYNSKALGFIDPSETNPVTAVSSTTAPFAQISFWDWASIGRHGQHTQESFASGSGVYSMYLATIGAFDTDIGDQQCRALARLLSEKYQIS